MVNSLFSRLFPMYFLLRPGFTISLDPAVENIKEIYFIIRLGRMKHPRGKSAQVVRGWYTRVVKVGIYIGRLKYKE